MSPTLRPPEEVGLKRTAMSTRELRRAEVLGRVKSETLRLVDAAKMLEVSYRQAKRLWQRYREEGAKGLQHRSAGRGSNRAKPEKFRRKVLQLIREKYSGTEQKRFGPTLAAEHLAEEDGLEVGEETLRRWMLAEGLWSRMRRRKAHRKRRERRQHFGDLVQMDGSFHAWSEERGPRGYLINMVDDVKTPSPAKLREVFRLETERWISNDWVVQYRGHFLQLKPQNKRYGPTQAQALICEWEDGAVEVHYRGERMDYEDLVVRPRTEKAAPREPRREPAKQVGSKRAQDHPWRQGYEQRMKLQRLDRSQESALLGVSACATP